MLMRIAAAGALTALVLTGCVNSTSSVRSKPLNYPVTPRQSVVDNYHGV
jgi:hypothetical protein